MAPEPARRPAEPDSDGAGAAVSLAVDAGAALPDRESVSPIGANVIIPANPAIAADVLAGEPDGLGADASARE